MSPGNRLEKLKGNRAGQHSIRVNDQWRICFRWKGGRRINEIVHGTRAISADTALRLARYFGTSDRFWLNLQARYDLEVQRDHVGAKLERQVRVLDPAS